MCADWKLIGNVRDTSNPKLAGDPPAKLFLSNLGKDVSEKKNFAKANPAIVKRLQTEHAKWLKSAQSGK